MNVIFLDIDGVLNSKSWNENHKEEIKREVFIDDLDLHNEEVRNHQFMTNNELGLTLSDAEKIIGILMRRK